VPPGATGISADRSTGGTVGVGDGMKRVGAGVFTSAVSVGAGVSEEPQETTKNPEKKADISAMRTLPAFISSQL
jgi:hypothetical protein